MNLEEQIEYITNCLNENNSLETKIEVLANVFISLGIDYVNIPGNEVITNAQILELVKEDRKEHGETIPNALVSQGLILLTWLAS